VIPYFHEGRVRHQPMLLVLLAELHACGCNASTSDDICLLGGPRSYAKPVFLHDLVYFDLGSWCKRCPCFLLHFSPAGESHLGNEMVSTSIGFKSQLRHRCLLVHPMLLPAILDSLVASCDSVCLVPTARRRPMRQS